MDDLSSLSVNTITENDEVINGCKKVDMMLFIEKDTAHYLEKFKKYESKKYFVSFNWAAFLFGFTWLFYRKMYKEGLLYLLSAAILSSITLSIVCFSIRGEVTRIQDEYEKSVSTIGDANYVVHNGTVYSNIKYKNMLDKLLFKIKLIMYIPNIIMYFFIGFFGNNIYRNHVLKNINASEGGVSVPSIFGALGVGIGYYFVIKLVFTVIIESIIG